MLEDIHLSSDFTAKNQFYAKKKREMEDDFYL